MNRLIKVVLVLFVALLVAAPASQLHAQTAWAPNTAYAVGALVTYQDATHPNHVYKCIQAHTSQVGWEPPNVPALWQDMGAAGGATATPVPPTKTNTPAATRTNTPIGPTPTRTNTPTGPTATRTNTPISPTATRTSTPRPTATPTTGTGACAYPAYVNTQVYVGGNRVSYNNHNWEAKWWTQGEAPSTGGSGVWTDLGACSGGSVPTNTPSVPTNTPVSATAVPTRTNTPTGPTPTTNPNLPRHIIIGYWHNFDNGSGFIPLSQVSNNFDIIDVSFAAPGPSSPNGQMVFVPYNRTDAEFRSDIATLHSRGKKVLISSGGYVGSTFTLSDTTAMNNFITSMENIISTYGFDGMDIDWEQNVLSLNQGDTNITAPTTPDVVNTINAITTIRNHFGANFVLTYGMETFFVQLGYQFYGGTCISCDRRAGSLLPVIYATRSFTNYVAVQLYNSGPITALDNNSYTNGGPDFLVAMTEMLLRGFPVAGTGQPFPALSPSQVAIGVPASTNAASAYVPPAQLQQAFSYLARGTSYGGAYHLIGAAGYPTLAGFMTWSVNWDQLSGFAFSNPIRTYLNGLP